ncbi:MAG: hypothetical protein IKB68_06470 [Rikenellaceae bacterium]|nr:hypothetical protein [Rikenellaceae bacterium]
MSRILDFIFSGEYKDYFGLRHPVAGKPTGQGNETKPFTHVKRKKKKYGERKLSKKERKTR